MTTEAAIRVGSFISLLIIMGTAETLWPRRVLDAPKVHRWFSNLSVAFLSTIIVRVLLPIVPAGFALYCSENGFGLFNAFPAPTWIQLTICVLLFDMLIYWQHVIFHKNQTLWRIHRMHHADTNIDASTGIRFHPIEIFLSILIKLIAIFLIGPSATAVIVFEILLNGCALFNHANVKIPVAVDSWLRLLVVTPDMHRVHHSTDMHEANTNFGFNFPWWDRVFNTYKPQPDLGHTGMRIGLNIFRDSTFIRLSKMLIIPFK